MPNFPSTLLPQTNEPLEIQKAILDLLDKINQMSSQPAVLPPGAIQMYGGEEAPEGFLLCDGASYNRVDYPELFDAIGTLFGSISAATFQVPDFRGVSPTGAGEQDINGRTKTGPALGAAREDAAQGHRHNIKLYRLTAGGPQYYPGPGGTYTATQESLPVQDPVTDGVNGTPRTGAYTHGPELGVHFIIKT